jgi:P-type Ca2+ transporter type 2C
MLQTKEDYYKLSPEASLAALQTSFDGLKSSDILSRQTIYGKNILKQVGGRSIFIKFFSQFKEVLIILLWASALISRYLQDYRGATILWIILLINVVIWYAQEAKAERIMESLKKMLFPTAKVKRDGKLIEEKAENLVPWDIIYIEEGDNVPADIRILQESELQANDFSLTGESNPMNKFTHGIPGDVLIGERNNCLWMGTTIATGNGRGVVFATGMDTELGRIANLSQAQETTDSPLQKEMANIAKKLTIGTLILVVMLVIISLLAHFSLIQAFIFAVGVSAAMIPEGLPAQVSIALALAASRLAKNKALVKQLSSVETLGCVNIICTDKTWTLTKNEMTVKHMRLGFQTYDVGGDGYEPIWNVIDKQTAQAIHPKILDQRKHFFSTLYLDSNARVNPPDDEHQTRYALGDPTEAALISLAQKVGIDTEKLDAFYKEEHQYGFDSVRKMMSSVRDIDGEKLLYVKWAPSAILDHCTQIFDGTTIRPLTDDDKKTIQDYIEAQASLAMRNLAFAYKPIPDYHEKMTLDEAEQQLIFLGCVSIIDPPREEVAGAIIAAHEAKIKIVMITGDYGLTAAAIARHIWLETDAHSVTHIAGEELKQMSDIQLIQSLEKPWSIIFSRTSPEDKLRIVSLLKKDRDVVAVTGDGINDAPALKKADIGVAMGKIGTDVAKESSQIILLDDSFHTLVYAIREWRIIFANLKKTILSCITSNGGELFAVLLSLFFGAVFGLPIAITAVQILAIDLITEMFPLTALTRDPPQRDLMTQWPRNISDHVINKPMIIDLIWSWFLMWWLWFLNYILYLVLHGHTLSTVTTWSMYYPVATSITYISIVFCQFMNILSRRAGDKSVFTNYLWSNKRLLWAFAISLICLMVLIYVPVVRNYFWFGSLQPQDRIFPITAWVIFLLVREGVKMAQDLRKED